MTEDQKYQGALYKGKQGQPEKGNQGKQPVKNEPPKTNGNGNGHGNAVNDSPKEDVAPVNKDAEDVSEQKKRKSTAGAEKDVKKAKKEKKNKEEEKPERESKSKSKKHSKSTGAGEPATTNSEDTTASKSVSKKHSSPLAEQFLSSAGEQLDKSADCTVHQLLKGFIATADDDKKKRKTQEKELWRSLKVKRNGAGEIILF